MNEQLKLRDVIRFSSADIESALAVGSKNGDAAATAFGALAGFAASMGADELNRVLETDLYALLAGAWCKVKSIRDGAAASRQSPDQVTVIKLGEHNLTHTCHPTLRVYFGEAPLPDLKLTLELTARFSSVTLAIRDGKLIALAPGETSAIVSLKYEGVKLREEATPAWKLPGEIRLGEGLLIG